MKESTDGTLKTDVLAELNYEPSLKVSDIGVMVSNGVVTLNGNVPSLREKSAAVRVVKRVAGVKAIADDIQVKLPNGAIHIDSDIAAAAVHQIECSPSIPADTVRVTVRDGWLTLEGNEEWWYQKQAVDDAVGSLAGVRGVTNLISIAPKIMSAKVDEAIAAAFERNAMLDAKNIKAETSGNKVTLSGHVHNFLEREEAERAAWSAAGVFSVDNQILVENCRPVRSCA